MKPYVLAVTSCDRHDLLQATLKSFVNTCDQSPRETIILEDSDKDAPAWLKTITGLGNVRWIKNGSRKGQWFTVDRLISEINPTYDYVFWCEDDWQFTDCGYLEQSFAILERYSDILQVWLRREDCAHPREKLPQFPFETLVLDWRGGWSGFSLNPGLRRLSDFRRLGPFRQFGGYGNHGLAPEFEASKKFRDMGFRAAVVSRECVRHIGANRSRAVEPLEQFQPKVLIAIPACHTFQYGKWESEKSPLYDPRNAYNGQPYGTDIHISGVVNPRIQAVRDTWLQDIKAYPNVEAKFFYGRGDKHVNLPEDSILLDCPDDYAHLPHKTRAICQWSLARGYDFLLKCDDDTFIYVDRLLAELDINRPDYGGYLHGRVCSGGPGYWLSRRAMAAVQDNPSEWAEDVWVAKCLHFAGIAPVMLKEHNSGKGNHWVDINNIPPDAVTLHAVKPEDMRTLYARPRG